MEKPAIGLFPKAFPLFMLFNDHGILKFFMKLKVQIRYPLACTDQMQIKISDWFLSENYSEVVLSTEIFKLYIFFSYINMAQISKWQKKRHRNNDNNDNTSRMCYRASNTILCTCHVFAPSKPYSLFCHYPHFTKRLNNFPKITQLVTELRLKSRQSSCPPEIQIFFLPPQWPSPWGLTRISF